MKKKKKHKIYILKKIVPSGTKHAVAKNNQRRRFWAEMVACLNTLAVVRIAANLLFLEGFRRNARLEGGKPR